MSPGDVLDSIISDPRSPGWRTPSLRADGSLDFDQHPHHGDGILLWGWVMERIRGSGPHHTPLSPSETERAVAMLRLVLESALAAKSMRRPHLTAVQGGDE